MLNGEYVYRDHYGEEIEVKDEDELWKILDKRLTRIVRGYEKEGWVCEDVNSIVDNPSVICARPCDEEERKEFGEACEETPAEEIQIGYDVEEISS